MKLLKLINLLMLGLYLFPINFSHADEVSIIPAGEFSKGKLNEWLPKKFVNETSYSLIKVGKNTVLRAVSQNSASGLIKKIRVDIKEYPFLNWSWRIENQLAGTFDEKQKHGDDYAARIYIVVSGGIAFWNTIALNYVWSKNAIKGETWPSAFATENSMMVSLRSSEAPVSKWHWEKRNIRKDFKKLFGREIQFTDAVVLMSDTDNTHKEVTAYYGDIYFSKQ
ncbi:MAG: DUF3047 domain-containing protein [Deltaproteobacteria bacterium]|nr:DUF3047 domain-containing protein [Deltaproteobacteria bacterium]